MKKVIWWCLHCERTYEGTSDDYYQCLYSDCDGHIGDIREWSEIRKYNSSYPATPQHGVAYPM